MSNENYWNKEYMDGVMNHCMVVHSSNEEARDDLYNTMVERHGNSGYYFAVGVYNGVHGFDKHCICGDHFCLFRRNGRNAFVIRNPKASSYCDSNYIKNERTKKQLTLESPPINDGFYFDLRPMAAQISATDGNPAALAIVRDYNGLRERWYEEAFESFNLPHTLTIVVAKKPQ